MRHSSSAAVVVVLSILAAAASREVRADEVAMPASAHELGRPDAARAAPPAEIAVEPRPLAWSSLADAGAAPAPTLVGGCGACRHECGTCDCGDRWRVALTIPIWCRRCRAS